MGPRSKQNASEYSMSDLRTKGTAILNKEETVLAVCCSDIHLSDTPPLWRSNEKDWFAVMERYLAQINLTCVVFECPLLIAGDVFDKWNPSAKLINFALDMLPPRIDGTSANVFAIAGQHDLPMHSMELIGSSGYGVLLKANKIRHLMPKVPYCTEDLRLYGASWKEEFWHPAKTHRTGLITVGLLHRHLWHSAKTRHVGASKKGNVSRQDFSGFDVIISGDNHKEFDCEKDGTVVFNCGSLMRRKSDEKDMRPRIGLLVDDGYGKVEVRSLRLDISSDVHLSTESEALLETSIQFDSLDKVLQVTGSLDFAMQLKAVIKELGNKEVRKLLTEALNAGQTKS